MWNPLFIQSQMSLKFKISLKRIYADLEKQWLTFSLPYMTEISVVIRPWT